MAAGGRQSGGIDDRGRREFRTGGGASVGAAAAMRPARFEWYYNKKPVFHFVGLFALLMAIFYAVTFIPYLNKTALPGLQKANARASTAVLDWFGESATSLDTTITSPRYSINVAHGCDAIEPAALFVAAVLAFPTAFSSKLPALFAGTAMLLILNLVRIVSLFYTGVYWPRAFETMHVDVWQPAFIVLSLVFWVSWALWATRARPRPQPVTDAPA